VRSRHTKFGHAVEDAAREPSPNDLRVPVTRMQAIAKDALVANTTAPRLCAATLRLLIPDQPVDAVARHYLRRVHPRGEGVGLDVDMLV
jgi:hypothetical protein